MWITPDHEPKLLESICCQSGKVDSKQTTSLGSADMFINLIKNPTNKFWNHDHEFVHCAAELRSELFWLLVLEWLFCCRLFESVVHSCMQKQTGSQAAMTREQHEAAITT